MISILIPAYNCKLFIEETILRLFSIDLKNVEIIVRDDGSTDGTWDKLLELSKKFDFKIFRNPINQGMCNNWNLLYADAKGDYILKLDADDIFFPEIISFAADFLKQNLAIDALAFKYEVLESETNISRALSIHYTLPEGVQSNLLSLIFLQNPFSLCFTIFKREALENVKRADDLFMNTEVGDLDLLLRLAENDILLYFKPTLAGYYRIHQTNSSKTPLKQAKSWLYDVFPVHKKHLSYYLYDETKKALFLRMYNYLKHSIYYRKLIDYKYFRVSILTYINFKKTFTEPSKKCATK